MTLILVRLAKERIQFTLKEKFSRNREKMELSKATGLFFLERNFILTKLKERQSIRKCRV